MHDDGSDPELDRLLSRVAAAGPVPVPLSIGDRVADRFVIEGFGGAGGMGTVYRAQDELTGEIVALKIAKLAGSGDTRRFAEEAKTLAGLKHPSIVRHVAHGVTRSGAPFMAMEWLEGEDLSDRLARGPLTFAETVAVATRLAQALAEAHRRALVHRDVKPSNVLLVGGDARRAKLLDFGIARPWSRRRSLTRTGVVVGSAGYMAPEQARGIKDLDGRADVFALGCVIFECIAGRAAFEGEQPLAILVKILSEEVPPLTELVEDVPVALVALVQEMLAKDSRERPPDGAAVLERLGAIDRVPTGVPEWRASLEEELSTDEQRLVSILLARRSVHGMGETLTPGDHEAELRLAADVVRRHGGEIEVLLDGALLATLTTRAGAIRQAAPAARCALALRDALPDLRVALAMGRASADRPLRAGEVIECAARLLSELEADENGDRIAVDEATAGLLYSRFVVHVEGPHRYLREERRRLEEPRTLLGKATPCIGRRKELALLTATLEECIEEPVAQVLLVTAPPGLGKSRLSGEFVRRVGDGVRVLSARGDCVGAGSALALARQLVREAVRVDREDSASSEDSLRIYVDRHPSSRGALWTREFVGELAGVPVVDVSPELRAARRDPQTMRVQLGHAFVHVLAAASGERALLIVLEDVHWGDVASLAFVRQAVAALIEAPLMVLALARPEIDETHPELAADPDVQRLRLTGLSRGAVRKMLASALEDPSESFVERIVERADGNALFVEELIRHGATGRDELPETVLAIMEARLEELAPEARRVLRAASVFGEVAWADGIAELLGGELEAGEVSEWLDRLIEAELLTRRGKSRFDGATEVAFRHGLLRDVCYAMLGEDDKRLGHRLAGDWLERAGEHDALRLAQHFETGGLPERCGPHFVRAAERAYLGGRLRETCALADRGVAAGASGIVLGQLRRIQCEGLGWDNGPVALLASASEAVSLLRRGSTDWFISLSCYAYGAISAGQPEELRAVVAKCAAIPDVLEPTPHVAISVWRLIASLLHMGEVSLVTSLALALERTFEGTEELSPLARGHYQLARGYVAAFSPEGGTGRLRSAMSGAESCDNAETPMGRAAANFVLGMVALSEGELDVAERSLRHAHELSGKHDIRFIRAFTAVKLSMLELAKGDLDAAERELDLGYELMALSEHSDQVQSNIALMARATIHLRRGRFGEADELCSRVLEQTPGLPSLRATALAVRARIQIENGHFEPARLAAEEGIRCFERGGGYRATRRSLEGMSRRLGPR